MNSVLPSRPMTATTRSKRSNLNVVQANRNAPMASLSKLSHNIHSCIFKFLDSHDLLNASQVCHSLRASASQNHLWESFIKPTKNQDKKPTRLLYLMQQTTLKNYFRPVFKNYKLNGHERKITAIDTDGDWVFTGSEDCKAKVWNIRKKTTFSFGHSDFVTDVKFIDGNPVSSSVDHTVRVWDLTNGGNLI